MAPSAVMFSYPMHCYLQRAAISISLWYRTIHNFRIIPKGPPLENTRTITPDTTIHLETLLLLLAKLIAREDKFRCSKWRTVSLKGPHRDSSGWLFVSSSSLGETIWPTGMDIFFNPLTLFYFWGKCHCYSLQSLRKTQQIFRSLAVKSSL